MKSFLRSTPPGPLFVLGLLTLPAFLFQEKLIFRVLEMAVFMALVLFSGKKIRPTPAILLVASVTAAALFVPYGKVLFKISGFPITLGALAMGFSRACLLLGLFYLSKYSIIRGLVFPGRIGDGIGKVFFYFERFSETGGKISIKDLSGSLDELLISVSESGDAHGEAAVNGEKGLPVIVPLLAFAGCWVLLFM